MNSGLIPYQTEIFYTTTKKALTFYSNEARSYEILGIRRRNGSGSTLAMKMRVRERERRKGEKQSHQPLSENRNYIKVHYTVLKVEGGDGMMRSGI